MKHFGLLGYPLGHSMSPFIHRELFRLAGQGADYGLFPFDGDTVKEKAPSLFSLDGFNITIPYKQTILPFLDRLDESAARYRSVNTVATGKGGGKKVGYNTDVYGFLASLSSMGASLEGDVLLLGAGGAGRMMAVETLRAGGKLTLAVRDRESHNVRSLLAFLEELFPGVPYALVSPEKAEGPFDLVLNATPVGMYPNPDAMPVGEETLAQVKYVFDAIYNPRETMLMQTARRHGAKVQNGMPMLVRQAAKAQEIWLGCSFTEEDITGLVDRAHREMERLFAQEKD